ncbi:MAG: hypothetical protein UV59_C0019G0006 [Candidatus Gottesmanbacteria bacterium GW2011_GWA1_43_11]|uniref:EGF-like domain-containing protein n=1 Tax=Candidatus Gottesmanbacteria bacterium GW2011_GWA1_43_11 TaxID=1618436 RepID=A0A0G1EN14_9BACT|nr:MAG: hypothetical protein UV59_C0019G0006 [Candidatus Gottesmanbacteria bacterium GW2011_GWA1_43_11]
MDNLSDPYQVNTDQNQPVMTTEPLVPAPGTDPQPPPAPFPDDGNGELPPVPANGFQNPLPPPPPEKKNKNRLLIAAIVLLLIITVPLVVYVAQQQQDIRQRASIVYPQCADNSYADECSNLSTGAPCLGGGTCQNTEEDGSCFCSTSSSPPPPGLCTTWPGTTCVTDATCKNNGGVAKGECLQDGALNTCCDFDEFVPTCPIVDCMTASACQSSGGSPSSVSCGSGQVCCLPGSGQCAVEGQYCGPGTDGLEGDVCCGDLNCDSQFNTCQQAAFTCVVGVGTHECTNVPEGWPCGNNGSCQIDSQGSGSECRCVGSGVGPSPTPSPSPTGCNNGNPNATTHRECVGNSCATVDNAPGVCDLEENNTCDNDSQCGGGGGNPSPTPTPQPVAQCTSIKIYQLTGDLNLPASWQLLTTQQLAALQPGTVIYITTLGGTSNGATITRARIRVNTTTWVQTLHDTVNLKPKTLTTEVNEYYLTYTIPTDGTANFTVGAEVYSPQFDTNTNPWDTNLGWR